MLTDRDLLQNKNKYSIDELKANVKHLNKKFLLHTQKLTEDFCVEYILDVRMDSGDEDSYLLCENYILEMQPHLDEKLFYELRNIKYPNLYED
jgi:hypothetical protein